MTKDEIPVLTPIGMLGYGIPENFLRMGAGMAPDVIALDSGSTDSGPQKLGLGHMTCGREAYERDLAMLLAVGHERKIPIYISSAGGDGSNAHVDVFLDIIKQISRAKGYRFRAAAIYSEIPKQRVADELRNGRVAPCGPVEPLNDHEIDASTTIVAQMGAEPFLAALERHGDLDIIVSGRAYDPAPIAVLGLRAGFDPALCWHMGKIMECGALCAEPNGRAIFGTLRRDHFELEPVNPAERCTEMSVAAHTLYEKSHPFLLPGPGGTLDLSHCRYRQMTDRRVRVSGSKFIPANPYTLKLEGAKKVGYRSIFIGGVRDPILIRAIDGLLPAVKDHVRAFFADVPHDNYQLIFHVYGKNGVMGELEPLRDPTPHELCIIGEVAAISQELATAICGRARTALLHAPYPGKMATAGNLALPFTPLEIPLGEVCAFNVYHLMEVDSPTELFPIDLVEI
jgi:hypothetical protein